MVLLREIRREQEDAGQMDGGVSQHAEQHRELSCHARRAAAPLSLVFGEAKLVDAVRRERVARPIAVCAASVDLGEVGEHHGVEAVRAADVALQAPEEAVIVEVAELLEVLLQVHEASVHLDLEGL